MGTPGDGTEPLDPAPSRWSEEPGPVSLDKPSGQAPIDFDPYRFGRPEHPIAPEYAPPGYAGPFTQPQPAAYLPPAGYPSHPGHQPPPYQHLPAGPPPPPYNLQYPPPRTGNGKAIAALVLGLASILFCWLSFFDVVLVVLAVVFGFIALGEAKRRPGNEGKGLAIAGLACALVGAILATVLTIVIYTKYKDCIGLGLGSSQYSQCISNHR
ncbi:MAG: DUF4190 domain-containing protein [Jatrophihabitantaceae bacterium]